MNAEMVSREYITEVFNNLQRRIALIVGAMGGVPPRDAHQGQYYESEYSQPTKAEAEHAFVQWNCAILTAFRGTENLHQNILRNNELKKDLRLEKMSFRPVTGCYREAEMENPVKEFCFFVTNNNRLNPFDFFYKIYRLAERYEQDSFLFTFTGLNRMAFLIATNDDGRSYFKNDIKFAGRLNTDVPDLGDWTQMKDGRISFRITDFFIWGGAGLNELRFGEGNIFDINRYNPDGLVVIRQKDTDEYSEKKWREGRRSIGNLPIATHLFVKENQTKEAIHAEVVRALNRLKNCGRIGFHCSATINGSSIAAAQEAYNTVRQWVINHSRNIERVINHSRNIERIRIIIVDTYGDYCSVQR